MKAASVFVLFAALCLPGEVLSETEHASNQRQSMRARMDRPSDGLELRRLIDESAQAYGALVKGPHGEVPQAVLRNARCIAILPGVKTGALILGGTHGSGIATCRLNSGEWSQPAPITMSQGSVGLQIGAKSADLVFYFQNAEAERALKKGEFTLGTDVSAVAGRFDGSVDPSSGGIIAYSRAEGVYAGISANSSKLSKDQELLDEVYGEDSDFTEVLEGRVSRTSGPDLVRLTSLLP